MLGSPFARHRTLLLALGFPLLAGLSVYSRLAYHSQEFTLNLPPALLIITLTLAGFAERKSALYAWNCVALSAILTMVLVGLINPDAVQSLWIYGVGIFGSWIVGGAALLHIRGARKSLPLGFYSAHWYTHPYCSSALLFAAMGLAGFPNTPAFVGEDVMLYYLVLNHLWLACVISAVFIVNGITLIRLYSHLCFGNPTWAARGTPVAAR